MTRVLYDGSSSVERAKDIVRRSLGGEYDILLACRDLANLRGCLPGASDDTMNTFVGVASEVDDLPLGPERGRWSADALKSRDIEAADYRERVRAIVEKALHELLISLGGRH